MDSTAAMCEDAVRSLDDWVEVDGTLADDPTKRYTMLSRLGKQGEPYSQHMLRAIAVVNGEFYTKHLSEKDIRPPNFLAPTQYWGQLRQVLSGAAGGGTALDVRLDVSRPSTSLQIKLTAKDDEGFSISMGMIRLDRNSGGLDKYAEVTANIFGKNQKAARELSKTCTELKKCNVKLERELHKAVQMKNSLEKELYTKFLSVLNEKKRKIKQLQEDLDDRIGQGGSPVREFDSNSADRSPPPLAVSSPILSSSAHNEIETPGHEDSCRSSNISDNNLRQDGGKAGPSNSDTAGAHGANDDDNFLIDYL